jgi:hypothetical protein
MPQSEVSSGPAKGRNGLALAAALLALPIVVVYAVLFREMRDVPLLDDYHAVLEFLLTLRQLPGLGSKLAWIIAAQHSEYKLIFEHILMAAQFAITGDVRFEFLIVAGNLMMLGILWVLWRNYFADEPDLTRRLLLFVPICYLIIQLNYVDTLDWAMCGLQTIPVNCFALATIHFLVRGKRRDFALACVCGVLCSFSSVNGFLAAPVGLLVMVPRRRWGQIAAWTATFCAALAVYLYRYTFIVLGDHGDHVSMFSKLLYWVLFLGGAAENQHRFPVKNGALVLGLVLVGSFVYACWRRYDRSQPFAFVTTVWVMLTAAMVAQGRSGGGLATALTGRYKIYSDLMLIFCYFCVASGVRSSGLALPRKRLIYATALVAVAGFSAASDWLGYKLLLKRNSRVALGLSQYVEDPSKNVPMVSISGDLDVGDAPKRARVILNETLASGIYRLPPVGER